MGTVVKLLFKQLESYSALRAIPHFPHRPLVVAVTSGNRLLFHALAVGAFIPAPLRSGNYVRASLRTPTLHYACIRASTSAPHGFGKYSFPFRKLHSFRFPQALFPHISSGMFYFLRRVCPKVKRASISPHRPLVVAVISGNRLLFHALAVGAFIPAPLRSGNYVSYLTPNPYAPLCLHSCIHLSTPRHKYSFTHSIYSVPSVIPMPFPTHFQRLPSFLRRVNPNEVSLFGFGMVCVWFLFPKGFKKQILR
jgi:hypothetical protein